MVSKSRQWNVIQHTPLAEHGEAVTVVVCHDIRPNLRNIWNGDQNAAVLVQELLRKLKQSFCVLLTVFVPRWNIKCRLWNSRYSEARLDVVDDELKSAMTTYIRARSLTLLPFHLRNANTIVWVLKFNSCNHISKMEPCKTKPLWSETYLNYGRKKLTYIIHYISTWTEFNKKRFNGERLKNCTSRPNVTTSWKTW